MVRPAPLLVAVAFALGACSGASAPTIAEVESICAPSNDRDTRTVENVRACMEVGGSVACYSDQQTGRDEVCDAAAEGLDPDDVRLSAEAEAHADLIERCYGDGSQSVEEFERCAAAAGAAP